MIVSGAATYFELCQATGQNKFPLCVVEFSLCVS
jgi:hypothetical protein